MCAAPHVAGRSRTVFIRPSSASPTTYHARRIRSSPHRARSTSGGCRGWVVEEDGVGRVDLEDEFILRQTDTLLRSFRDTFDREMFPSLSPSLSQLERARCAPTLLQYPPNLPLNPTTFASIET
jgi:hypothetical protein